MTATAALQIVTDEQALERAKYGPGVEEWAARIGRGLDAEIAWARTQEEIRTKVWRGFEEQTGLVVLSAAAPDVTLKKPVRSAVLPADAEPVVDEFAASAYLGFKPITCLRMAKRGQIPSVPFPVGSTTKIRRKFRISELKAYIESLSRAPLTRAK
ncbi:MAG: hypothetical protein ABSE46_21295 [Terracidiphilus sp.]|jgi:hypothetical protein